MANLYMKTISKEQFHRALALYSDTAPAKLKDLDEQRYHAIPALVADRDAEGEAYLSSDELVTLVEWKVSHGKFRPSLKKLASENNGQHIRDITRKAFSMEDIQQASKALCALRGVGPATASLLLSVHKPSDIPFFSDELFRWCAWVDESGCRWDRAIKYNAKEYTELYASVSSLQQRFKIRSDETLDAVDIEKAAYVLGKHEMDLNQPIAATNEHEDIVKATPKTKAKPTKKKRRVEDADASLAPEPHEAPGRRTRRKRIA